MAAVPIQVAPAECFGMLQVVASHLHGSSLVEVRPTTPAGLPNQFSQVPPNQTLYINNINEKDPHSGSKVLVKSC